MMKSLSVVPFLFFAACAGGDHSSTAQRGLELTQYTDSTITGTYRDNVTTLSVESKQPAAGIVNVRIAAASLIYQINLDYTQGVVELIAPTDAADRETVDALR